MGKGSSRTLAIEWTFGSDAQPDINNPLLVLKAWFRFLDSEQLSQVAITKAWHKGYHDIHQSILHKKLPWEDVTSAMSATLLHLIQLKIRPINPSTWYRGDSDNILDTPIRMDMADEMDRETNMQWIKNRLAKHMWESVTAHPANGGLWDGEAADFQRTKNIHQRLLANGQVAEAQALRAIVTHNVWYAQRATKDPEKWKCPRCDDGDETLLHRL